MNSRRCSLILASMCSLLLVPLCQAQEINLFNGRDLTGWVGLKEFWSVKNGAITCRVSKNNLPKEQSDLIWQGGQVTDFELTCKVRMEEVEGSNFCNTGIYFRSHIVNPKVFHVSGYQADLVRNTRMPTVLGALMGEDGGNEKAFTKTGQQTTVHDGGAIDVTSNIGDGNVLLAGFKTDDWNDCRVIAIGNRMQFFLNGQLTSEVIDQRSSAPTSGLVALQLLARKPMQAQFKDIRLRVLKGSAVTPQQLPITPTLTLDPNQPLLDTFSQLAPNASAWVLAALDEGVPPNVRQNLTYLREDLLDEYKQKPKASQDAYRVAHQLCTTMIAALDERDQTLVRAGFRAVQADANATISGNQALNARRNYMMSWPQYAREQAQRAELRSEASNKSQLMKEQPKVEWSTRTAALRKTIDSLYAQFREALRQGKPAAK